MSWWGIAFFDTTPTGRFLRLLVAFTHSLDIQVHVSWYQSIGMHFIVLAVKFEDGLSISVLRKGYSL
jgi:hypothetical protein